MQGWGAGAGEGEGEGEGEGAGAATESMSRERWKGLRLLGSIACMAISITWLGLGSGLG